MAKRKSQKANNDDSAIESQSSDVLELENAPEQEQTPNDDNADNQTEGQTAEAEHDHNSDGDDGDTGLEESNEPSQSGADDDRTEPEENQGDGDIAPEHPDQDDSVTSESGFHKPVCSCGAEMLFVSRSMKRRFDLNNKAIYFESDKFRCTGCRKTKDTVAR